MAATRPSRMKRFESLADTMAKEIRSGSLPTGSRLPSLRHVMAQHGVSQSTVFRAYYLLEDWGSDSGPRERSGYFCRAGALTQDRVAASSSASSSKVEISDLVFSVLDAAKQPGIVPFGSAFPSPSFFLCSALGNRSHRPCGFTNPWSTVVDLPPGNEQLRRQIALRYVGIGIAQSIEEIVITNGALEALNLCLTAVTRPGDVVAVESPGFYAALQAIERLDLRAVEIPVDPRTGLDLEALARALEEHPIRACWFMTNFQNPTGVTLTPEKKQALVALLADL